MRLRLLLAGAALLAGGLTGCGGGGDGDGDADAPSTKEFCGALQDFQDDFADTDPTKDLQGYIKDLKAAADKLKSVGTPADMPDDARHGFELFVDQAKKLDENATLQDLENLGEDLSSGDQADGEAFSEWTTKNCPLDLPSGLPSIDPSDLPSIDPSDLPSMDPSDLESMMSELSELTQSP